MHGVSSIKSGLHSPIIQHLISAWPAPGVDEPLNAEVECVGFLASWRLSAASMERTSIEDLSQVDFAAVLAQPGCPYPVINE
jgi:hypothetical protein